MSSKCFLTIYFILHSNQFTYSLRLPSASSLIKTLSCHSITTLHLYLWSMEQLLSYPFQLLDGLLELTLEVEDDTGVTFIDYTGFVPNKSTPEKSIVAPLPSTRFEERIVSFIQEFTRLQILSISIGCGGGLKHSFDLLRILSSLQQPIQKLSFSSIHFPITNPAYILPYLSKLKSLRLSHYLTDCECLQENDTIDYLDNFWKQLQQTKAPLTELFVIFPTRRFLSCMLSLSNITHLAFHTIDSKDCADFFFAACLPHITPSIISLKIVGCDERKDEWWHLSLDVAKQLLLCKSLYSLSIPATTKKKGEQSSIAVFVLSFVIL